VSADASAEFDRRCMTEALVLAAAASGSGEVPVGAVLARDGQVIARAANAPIGRNDPTAHAEILVLRAAGERIGNYRLTGTTLYVTLEPCPMCAAALVHARVSRLVFAAADPKTGAAGSIMNLVQDPRLNHRIEFVGGLMSERAATLLQDFFRARRGD
jgi:tRNA(adenine34) deaminase